jgi:predicted GTPase
MTTLSIDELYEQQIKPLSRAQLLRLMARIAQDLVEHEERTMSAVDILAQTSGGRIFRSVEEVTLYLAEERTSWDH